MEATALRTEMHVYHCSTYAGHALSDAINATTRLTCVFLSNAARPPRLLVLGKARSTCCGGLLFLALACRSASVCVQSALMIMISLIFGKFKNSFTTTT